MARKLRVGSVGRALASPDMQRKGANVRRVLLLGAALLVGSTGWAAAQTTPTEACTEREKAVRHLSKKFSELQEAAGVTNSGEILEVFTSKDGRSWTMLMTMPNGKTCLVAAGEAWKEIPPVATLYEGW
jgi:hypothetical protein